MLTGHIYFATAAVAVDSSRMTASSSASWSRFSPPSDLVNGHVSTMWFMVCRWPQSQEGDWVRPPSVQVSTTLALTCPEKVHHRPVTVPPWGRGAQALQIVATPPNYTPSPQIVARRPNSAVLLTHCDPLICRIITRFDAMPLRLKCTKIDFRWISTPDPTSCI